MGFKPISETDFSKLFPDTDQRNGGKSSSDSPSGATATKPSPATATGHELSTSHPNEPGKRTTRHEAEELVKALLRGYASLKDMHDIDGYMSNIASILQGYVRVDAQEGIRYVANHGGEFAPSRYAVKQACDAALSRRVKLERLHAIPAPVPHEHHRRPADPAPDPVTGKHPPGTILTNFDEAVRLYGRPIGVFEKERMFPYATEHD